MLPPQTVIIAGPTGVGKTDFALRLAKILHAEIISADAFQIYAGLSILTSQPLRESETSCEGIRYHMIGTVPPDASYDVGRYLQEIEPILQKIILCGRIPMIVGGTGLYLKALLLGMDPMPRSDPELRKQFSKKTLPELINCIRSLDPQAEYMLNISNRRRVERALEILLLTGKPLASSRTQKNLSPVEARTLLLIRDKEELNARISTNVELMFSRGVEAEVADLPEEKIGQTASMAIGMRELRKLARGEITRIQAIQAIKTATRRYAKRQMTWFSNQHDFPALNLSRFPVINEAIEDALRLLG